MMGPYQFGLLSSHLECTSLGPWLNAPGGLISPLPQIAKKVGRDPNHLIMMTAAEYREKSETYDVLQMAIPTKDKQVRAPEGYSCYSTPYMPLHAMPLRGLLCASCLPARML